MKSLKIILLLLIITATAVTAVYSQKGKEYYLLDSVNYPSLPEGDKLLLDSLLPLYHAATHDTSRLQLLVGLCEKLSTETLWPRYNDLVYQRSGELLGSNEDWPSAVLRSLKSSYAMSIQNKGYFEENYSGNVPVAMEYYEKCLRIQEEIGDKKNLSTTYNNIGIALYSQGDIKRSLEYYMMSAKIKEEINDKAGLAYALGNLSNTYLSQGDTALALDYQNRSIKLREEIGDNHGLAISLSNTSAIYSGQGNYDKALSNLYRGLEIWKVLGDKQGLAHCYRAVGNVMRQKAEKMSRAGTPFADTLLPRAEYFLMEGLRLCEEVGDKRGMAISLLNIGSYYLFKKNTALAKKNAERSLAISRELGHPNNLRVAASLLHRIYKETGDWENALAMHELATAMRDSIQNADTKKATYQKQMKYEYEKQQALQAAENNRELVVAEEGKKRQLFISVISGVGLLAVILFIVFVTNRIRITRKQQQVIEEQKQLVDKKNGHILDSILYAKRIQDALLPDDEEIKTAFSDHFIFFLPRETVSGDFYWLSRQGEKTLLAVGDCTGHGVPGAFMSMIGNTLLNEIVNEQKSTQPADILRHLHEGVVHTLHKESRTQEDGMDISVCLFDSGARTVTFAGANHSLFIVQNNELKIIEGNPVSIGSSNYIFDQKTIPLTVGSTIFFSTDGFMDQPGGDKGRKFMRNRFQELLKNLAGLPAAERGTKIRDTFNAWKGTRSQIDDVLVIGVSV